ncbi:MAG: DDE-type integrase/transposase/recombinase [Acidiferrobacter sp.]
MTRQCELLAVARSTVYYPRRPAVSDDDLRLMRRLDEVHLQYRFLGTRPLRNALEQEGDLLVNHKRIQRLMRIMGLYALYPKRKTSLPGNGRRIFPYLLRGLAIERLNQVWCTDVTYIPMRQGFCYLVAIMDWASRAVLSWRLSTTMEADFCVAALEEAIARYGAPEIFTRGAIYQ